MLPLRPQQASFRMVAGLWMLPASWQTVRQPTRRLVLKRCALSSARVASFSSSLSSGNHDMVASLFDKNNINNKSSSSTSSETHGERVSTTRQSVAVIGAGAVGSYYGARLWQAGHDVQFHLRRSSPVYDLMQRHGLRVTSIDGDLVVPPDDLELFDSTSDMQSTPDWILIGLKSTALSAIPDLILPLLSPKVKILVLMNGLIDQDLIRCLKQATGQSDDKEPLTCCRTLYGGLAFIAANRSLLTGGIHHIYAGPIAAGVACTTITSDTATITAREELQSLWQLVPTVPCQWEDNLAVGRWRKMLWNLPFNGISVAMGGIPTDEIVNDPGLRTLARRIMEETLAIARADCGSERESLNQSHIESMFALTDSMDSYRPSTMIDLLERRPMEVEYLFRKPLQRAHELGVDTPHLYTIVTMIEAVQRKHHLY